MLTLGATDNIAAKQDTGTDVLFNVNGDDVTLSPNADTYMCFGQGALSTTATALFTAPAAGHAFIIDHIKVTNTNTTTTRTVTFYFDKGGTTYDGTTQWGSPIALGASESGEWNGNGWTIYSSTGIAKAPGAGTQSLYLINVKDFGAKGDDSADDTVAIKAARDYGVTNYGTRGWTMFFPEGRYRISSVIAFASSNISILGTGRGTSQIWNTNAYVAGDMLTFGAQSQVTITDISVWSSVARTSGSGIAFNGTSSVVVDSMFIWNQFIGIDILSPAQLISIANVTIHGPSTAGCYGINIDTNAFGDLVIGPNVVLSQVEAGNNGTGIQINGCLYTNILATDVVGWKNGMVMNPPANQSVTWTFLDGVLFDSCGEIGVALYSNGATQIVRGVFFNNCWFASSGVTGAGALGDGVNLNAGAGGIVDDIKFTGSRFLKNKGHGLHVQSALITNLQVNGCSIFANGEATANTYDGIKLVTTMSDFMITGNMIGGPYGTFTNQQKYAVELPAGTSNNYLITNNQMAGNTTANNTGTVLDGGVPTAQNTKLVTGNVGFAVKGVMDTKVAATAGLNTTETILIGGVNKAPLPANCLTIGDTFEFELWGTNTSTVGNVTTFRIRIGVNGTTADGAVMTVALPVSAAAGTTIPFHVRGVMTIRTLGAAATVHGSAFFINQSVTSNATASTGISVFADQVIIPTFATFASTAANYIEVTHVTAATTTTSTFQGGWLRWN